MCMDMPTTVTEAQADVYRYAHQAQADVMLMSLHRLDTHGLVTISFVANPIMNDCKEILAAHKL